MTILVKQDTYITGSLFKAGARITLDGALEAQLVSDGKALYVSKPYSVNQADLALHAEEHQMLGVSAGPGVPAGLGWLDDTLNGIDLYAEGFVKTPTIFFDPSATTSKGLGTFKNPYTTQQELMTAVNGIMGGQVLGIKRGTRLAVTGASGLELNVCGQEGRPFSVVPYGDAEDMPVISGAVVIASWALADAGLNIWSYPIGSTEYDVWQSGVRLWKKTWAGSAPATLSMEGDATFSGGTLYVRPYNGENPNLGQMTVNSTDYVFTIKLFDTAATGYVAICGLDVEYARNTGILIHALSGVASTSCSEISIVGCRASKSGVDNTENLGRNGIGVTGKSNAVRATNVRVVGNYIEDVLNNPVETSNINGGIIEMNRSYNHAGNGIELWSSNSNVVVRYNWLDFCSNRELRGSRQRLGSGLSGCGIWFNNYDNSTLTEDATATLNVGNVACFNLITRARSRGIRLSQCGNGCKVQHNTIVCVLEDTHRYTTSGPQGIFVANAAFSVPNGWCDISNNLIVFDHGGQTHYPGYVRLDKTLGANAGVPAGGKNVYFDINQTGVNGNWYCNGGSMANFTSYKSALAAYSFDQDSMAKTIYVGGTLTDSALGFESASNTVLAAAAQGRTTLSGIGSRYFDGRPYSASGCTIGALNGR